MPTNYKIFTQDKNSDVRFAKEAAQRVLNLPEFCQIFEFSLPVPAGKSVSFSKTATRIQGRFQPVTYDALAVSLESLAVAPKVFSGPPAGVRVTLDAPRQVVGISLTKNYPAETRLEFYRLDGEQASVKPVVTVNLAPQAEVDFSDQRFVVALSNDRSLAVGEIDSLLIRSYPAAPRVRIASARDPDHPLTLWSAPGEIGKPGGADLILGEFELGKAFAEALERLVLAELNRTTPPPEQVDFSVVVESDAPCLIDVPAITVTAYLVQQTFPGGEDRQVLRFSGKGQETQDVAVDLPGHLAGAAPVVSASLKVSPSFRGEAHIPAGAVPEMLPALTGLKTGVEMAVRPGVGQRCAAQVFQPAEPTPLRGVALALMATSAAAELKIELVEDINGRPVGSLLAESRVKPDSLGAAGWYTALFKQSVILAAQAYWLLVQASQGSVIWLLAEASQNPVRVLQRAAQGSWEELSVLAPLQALYTPFVQNVASPGSAETGVFHLSVGARTLQPEPNPNPAPEPLVFDLRDALNQYIAAHPSQGEKRQIPLAFTAALPGLVTVYPPVIVFDPG